MLELVIADDMAYIDALGRNSEALHFDESNGLGHGKQMQMVLQSTRGCGADGVGEDGAWCVCVYVFAFVLLT